MNIRSLIPSLLLAASLVPACHSDSKKDADCPDSGVTTSCIDEVLTTCVNGVKHTEPCKDDRSCVNASQCVPLNLQCQGDTFVSKCTGEKTFSVCKNNVISEETCPTGKACDANSNTCIDECTGDDCGEQTCLEDGPVICDENDSSVRLLCVGGKRIPEKCPTAKPACANGICQDPNKPTLCGNRRIDGEEVCDYHDFGLLSCNNIDSLDHTRYYSGSLTCSDDCSEISTENCVATTCGDGIRQENELCDTAKDGSPIHSTFPSCNDYANIASKGLYYVDGGEPGCSKDCKGYSKGTCVIADQPRDGIQMCEFAELTTYLDPSSNETWMQGKLNIVVDADTVDESLLYGRLVCGHAELQTYFWSFKEAIPNFAITDDQDGDPSTVTMNAWLNPTGWGPGTYECVFQINAANGYNSFYNCPLEMGYPAEQDFVDSDKYRPWRVETTDIVGDVVAHWHFENLGEKGETVDSAKADDGANASSAVITVTPGTNNKATLELITGINGYPTVAISADGWSQDTSLISPLTQKHFVVKFDTTGFENIRVQMSIAASGTNSGMVAATYSVGSLLANADNYSMKNTDRSWEPWSFVLDSAQNAKVTLNLYNYGNSDTNARWRIDELYILGDKIP